MSDPPSRRPANGRVFAADPSRLRKTTHVHPIKGAEKSTTEPGRHRDLRAVRRVQGLVLAACVVLLAACGREEPPSGESPQVTAAKAAVAHKLNTPDGPEFKDIIEYRDGVVCGEFNARKMFSGTDVGFRKFIYNAPEPGTLAIDSGNLSRQEIGYWCSDEPDKKLRMLAASVAELAQACAAAGGKGAEMSCRLAETQKRAMAELQGPTAAARGAPAGQAGAAGPVAAVPVAAAPVVAAPVAAAPVANSVAAAPAASATQPPAAGKPDAAILAEVETALRTWRERWQAGDVDGYLRLYEPSFAGGAGSRAAWEQQRRQKMTNVRPAVGVEGLQAVRITPQEVELRFVQVYSARQHRDRGNKTMVFRRSPQGWLIADERWTPLS